MKSLLFLILVSIGFSTLADNKHQLPAVFKQNRIFMTPILPDGTKIRFYSDTGGGWNAISKELVDHYGWAVETKTGGEKEFLMTAMPKFKKGYNIPIGGMHNFMQGLLFVVEKAKLSEDGEYQGFLGGRWHAEKIIEFDYLNQTVSIIKSLSTINMKSFNKIKLGFQKNQRGKYTMAFPSVEVKIDEQSLPMLFDTGATATLSEQAKEMIGAEHQKIGISFIVASVFEQWRKRHPNWRVIEGGDASLGESMIEVPLVMIAGNEVGPVWFARRNDKNFHGYMSSMMDRKVDGAVGGSLLQYLRIIVDYPGERAYISSK